MNLGNYGEILAYALTFGLAISAGLIMGITSWSRHERAGYIAGLLIVVVVVIGGLAVGSQAPWIGPIFILVAVITRFLAAATALADSPAMKNESFGRRLVFTLRPRSSRGLTLDNEQ